MSVAAPEQFSQRCRYLGPHHWRFASPEALSAQVKRGFLTAYSFGHCCMWRAALDFRAWISLVVSISDPGE